MTAAHLSYKILWAVDPFVPEKKILRTSARAVSQLAQSLQADVEPVYYLRTFSLDVPLDLSAELAKNLRESAQLAFKKGVQGIPGISQAPLTVLTRAQSPTSGVQELIGYAKMKKADLIVLSTHARSGIQRLLMGSFAEDLMLHSDIPLFVVPADFKKKVHLKQILFPTDFSSESKAAFDQVLKWGSERCGTKKILLMHQFRLDWMMGLGESYSSYPEFQKIFDDDLAAQEKKAQEWAQHAKRMGFKVEVVFNKKMNQSPAEAILKQAKKLDGVIAMVARSGAASAVLLGSTTRKVVRGASCPVWVVHL